VTEPVSDALTTWVLDTDLKQRVAANESRLEARIQFQHIGRILDLARFVEDCPLLDSSWDAFCQALERAFRYSAPDFYSEVDVKEGGVLVDSARVVKNASWKAVFVLNVSSRSTLQSHAFHRSFRLRNSNYSPNTLLSRVRLDTKFVKPSRPQTTTSTTRSRRTTPS